MSSSSSSSWTQKNAGLISKVSIGLTGLWWIILTWIVFSIAGWIGVIGTLVFVVVLVFAGLMAAFNIGFDGDSFAAKVIEGTLAFFVLPAMIPDALKYVDDEYSAQASNAPEKKKRQGFKRDSLPTRKFAAHRKKRD